MGSYSRHSKVTPGPSSTPGVLHPPTALTDCPPALGWQVRCHSRCCELRHRHRLLRRREYRTHSLLPSLGQSLPLACPVPAWPPGCPGGKMVWAPPPTSGLIPVPPVAVTSQVLVSGSQLAAGHSRSSRVPSDCSRLQATVVCDLVLLYLDAKADVYWKEKFEEVRRGLCQEVRLEGSSAYRFHPFLPLVTTWFARSGQARRSPSAGLGLRLLGLGGCSDLSLARQTRTSSVTTSSWRRDPAGTGAAGRAVPWPPLPLDNRRSPRGPYGRNLTQPHVYLPSSKQDLAKARVGRGQLCHGPLALPVLAPWLREGFLCRVGPGGSGYQQGGQESCQPRLGGGFIWPRPRSG